MQIKICAFLAEHNLPISLSDGLVQFLQSLFPRDDVIKTVTLRKQKASNVIRQDKPWVTPEFKKIIESRQKAFHDGKTSHYRRLRNQVNRETKKLRSTFLEKKLAQLKLNPNPKKVVAINKTVIRIP